MTTLKDIARETGLSPKAVSLAINGTGRLSPETRQRVLEVARRMNYRPNRAARSLVLKKSHLIGVALPYAHESFFSHIIAGLEQVSAEQDYSLLLVNADPAMPGLERAWNYMMQHNIDGLVAVPLPDLKARCRLVTEAATPFVQVMNVDADLGVASVRVDNAGGARRAVEYLKDLGHRHIGLITHDARDFDAARERRRAFDAAMAEFELPCSQDLREYAALSFDGGFEAAGRLFRRCPEITALFACSDYAALGAVRALLSAGRRVPEDVSIVGFDDVPEASCQTTHPLTTVAQPKREVGLAAGRMLLDMIAGGDGTSLVLPTELRIRGTTAEARN